ncbi:rod shape-determining protein MreD [Castellaniella ginsengisoli]|jgi:rod shape-determining protein MreD|uniref:Rod shape-determining protein MreD n=1 Tax=Castellaniella ginsengisoli TaxID=546114 RepID=A0AB39E7D8_9BURK
MPSTPNKRQGGSSLMALQPVDAAAFQNAAPGWLVWGSLILVWMASLLPWRLWQPVPDVLLLMLLYWCLRAPARVGLTTAFVFGLLMDVQDAGLLGLHALCYVLAAYGILRLSHRLRHFNAWLQTLQVLPVFVGSCMVSSLLGAWLSGAWEGWNWLWSALFTGILWPLPDVLMSLRPRRLGGDGAGPV